MLKKTLTILNAISQVILIITAIISLFTAYIVFVPDDMPKPFHLVYDNGSGGTQIMAPALSASVSAPTAAPEAHAFTPGEGIMINMSTKIINLVDPGGRKYIRLTVVVEFAPDNPEYASLTAEEKTAYLTQFQEKLTALMPIMDDTVITLLSTKSYDDLYTADGKEKLRGEILETLSKKLPDYQILSIYFTEFVVQ